MGFYFHSENWLFSLSYSIRYTTLNKDQVVSLQKLHNEFYIVLSMDVENNIEVLPQYLDLEIKITFHDILIPPNDKSIPLSWFHT